MTAPLPRQRGPLLDIEQVAGMLGRSVSYVRRRLIRPGLLTPVEHRGPQVGGGRPRALLDVDDVFALLHDTPSLSRHS